MITNPPYEIYEKKDCFILLIEIVNLERKSLRLSINKRKNEFNCLILKGNRINDLENDIFGIKGGRNHGEFVYFFPLGKNKIEVAKVEVGIIEQRSEVL